MHVDEGFRNEILMCADWNRRKRRKERGGGLKHTYTQQCVCGVMCQAVCEMSKPRTCANGPVLKKTTTKFTTSLILSPPLFRAAAAV